MTKIELKPCPFCGCKTKVAWNWVVCSHIKTYSGYCLNKKCILSHAVELYTNDKNEAIQKWNSRANKPEPITKKELENFFVGTNLHIVIEPIGNFYEIVCNEINAHFLGEETNE